MIMCVLLCYPVSIHMSQLLSTGRPISSLIFPFLPIKVNVKQFGRTGQQTCTELCFLSESYT